MVQTGANSSGNHTLMLSGFDVSGEVKVKIEERDEVEEEEEEEELPNSQASKVL